jgi:DNA-binding transcriptional MerR regulator
MGALRSFDGVYTADRAAALAGVPKTTLYYWAREGVYAPSASPLKIKRWSFLDLLALRAIYWLRQDKSQAARTTMRNVRAALENAAEKQIPFGELNLLVDPRGRVHFRRHEGEPLELTGGQEVLQDPLGELNLLTEYRVAGSVGPDLRVPKPELRIIPGKLTGEPHVSHTRVATIQLWSLHVQGFDTSRIERLYPVLHERPGAIQQSISLEAQLSLNVAA